MLQVFTLLRVKSRILFTKRVFILINSGIWVERHVIIKVKNIL